MSEAKIKNHTKYDLVDISKLKPNPKNRNKHDDAQIARLAEILEYQGWRYPIKVSNLSGFISSGHGRLLAAQFLGLKKVPVNYQDYESEEQEYADLVSDNAIALWAEMDMAGINADLPDLGPEFNIDMLGIKNFVLDMSDKIDAINRGDENSEWVNMPEFTIGESYIRIVLNFSDKEKREKYFKNNNLEIYKKMSDDKIWIVNIQ